MFEWLFLLFTPAVPYAAPAPAHDYIGMVAAEAAYAALLPSAPAPEPDDPAPRPVDPNCPTCKGTGRVRSGDDQSWTKCPTCQPLTAPAELPRAKSTLPPGPFAKPQQTSVVPQPPAAPKAAAVAPVIATPAPCVNGACPLEKAAPVAPLSGIPIVPVPVSPRRIFRRR
jgi:hypothetical protein